MVITSETSLQTRDVTIVVNAAGHVSQATQSKEKQKRYRMLFRLA